MENKRPVLGITMGDPCGIGPEITGKALAHKEIYDKCRPIVVGSARVLQRALTYCGCRQKIHPVADVREAKFSFGTVDVLDQDIVNMEALRLGTVSALGGKAAYRAVEQVIKLAMDDLVDGTVTGPLNKEALRLAGVNYSGHTEIYADLTKTGEYCMMLVHGAFRVAHISTHVSLRKACDRCKKEREYQVICLADQACRDMGILHPKVAVAGLNPHSGENGLFGREEIEEILPAIRKAAARGIDVEGPLPADTVFSKARGGQYDIVVAQYHDQGHIPMKMEGFCYNHERRQWDSVSGVNVTLGLPVIRCSVDHGTAFDQAGKGSAKEDSMVDAICLAARLAGKGAGKKGEERNAGMVG